MRKKIYDTPEMEIDLFFINCNVVTLSIETDDGSIGDSGSDYEGGDNWDF